MRHRASRTQAEITSLIDLRCQRAEFKATGATGNGKGNPRKRDPERERAPKSAYEFKLKHLAEICTMYTYGKIKEN